MSRPLVAILSGTALLLFSVRAAGVAGCPPGWWKSRPPASELLICWRTDEKALRVEMSHPGHTWLALGFGEAMAGADAVVGRPETGEVLDVSIAGTSADSITPDSRQDVSDALIAFDGAHTVLRFARALDTGDAEDFAIAPGQTSSVVWAVGNAPGFSGHFARGVLQMDWKTSASFAWSAKIIFHVCLMLLAWGLLVPLGIVIARYFKVLPGQDFPRELDDQFWWNWHRILQYGGMLAAVAALIPVLRAHRDGINDWHSAVGFAALGLGWLQVLSGVLRGSKGGPVDDDGRPNPLEKIRGDHYHMTLRRRIFEFVHKTGGYLAVLAGCAAVALGLVAVGAHWVAWLAFACWLGALTGWFTRLQKSGRWVDTHVAIWGPDKRHPGQPRPMAAGHASSGSRRIREMKIECVVEIPNIVGESPMWSVADQSLWWVDVRGKSLHRLRADGKRDDWRLPDFISCLALCRSGRLIVSQGNALAFFNPQDGALAEFARPEPDRPANRFNDGKCDRLGRFWIGTMVNNFGADGADIPIDRPDGAFYRLDPDLKMTRVVDEMWIPNTVAWSPDDRMFYLGDSGTNEIRAYDFDLHGGGLGDARLFAKNADPGHLDGSAVDAEGFLWNTHWGAGKIVRYNPQGGIDREISFPVPAPSSCIFGGPDLDCLYVTTARDTLSAEQLADFPLSGSVFAFKPGVQGLPEPVFAD